MRSSNVPTKASQSVKKKGHTPCVHGVSQKYMCPICGGKGLCIPHQKQKHSCIQCKSGKGICEHGKNLTYCKQCQGKTGNLICIHLKTKYRCAICDGRQLCSKHGKVICKDCDAGKSFCVHSKYLYKCLECWPEAGCIHGHQTSGCGICGYKCEQCGLFHVSKKNPEGKRLCQFCNVHSKLNGVFSQNRDEVQIAQEIAKRLDSEHYHVHPIYTYSPYRECNDANRPDIFIDAPEFKVRVLLECDEHGHSRKEYTPSCEFAKILNHAQSTCATDGFEHVLAIRINPNVFRDKKGKIVVVSFAERMDALQKIIERIPDMVWPEGSMQMKMCYLYYKNKDAEEWVDETELKEWFTKLQQQPQQQSSGAQ